MMSSPTATIRCAMIAASLSCVMWTSACGTSTADADADAASSPDTDAGAQPEAEAGAQPSGDDAGVDAGDAGDAGEAGGPCVPTEPPYPPPMCTTTCSGGTLAGDSLFTPVNRFTGLKSDWVPAGLTTVPLPYRTGDASQRMRAAAKEHLVDMLRAASGNGAPDVLCRSPYRSFAVQCSLFASYAADDGCAQANTYSAQAGHSEHQLGTVCDLAKPNGDFIDGTGPVDTFLAQHAYEYGFIMSYPAGTEALTGYQYEPWHWRYVGVKAALMHHGMQEAAARAISTHELMASIACLPAAQRAALEAD